MRGHINRHYFLIIPIILYYRHYLKVKRSVFLLLLLGLLLLLLLLYEDLRLLVPAVLRRLVRDCTSYAHPHALARRVQTQATSDHFL